MTMFWNELDRARTARKLAQRCEAEADAHLSEVRGWCDFLKEATTEADKAKAEAMIREYRLAAREAFASAHEYRAEQAEIERKLGLEPMTEVKPFTEGER